MDTPDFRFDGTCFVEGSLVKSPGGQNIYIYIADGLSKIPDLTMSPETRFLLRSWDPRHLGDAKGDRGTRP